MDLLEIREKLDHIDEEIVALFEKRMELCKEVAEFKIQSGKQVWDREREEQKLKSVELLTETSFNKKSVRELFTQIMSISRKLQYQLLADGQPGQEQGFGLVSQILKENVRVVFQGVEGANSQEAMRRYFGEDIDSYHVELWRDAMWEIASGKADYAVLPIENSTAGSVMDIYDLLIEFDNYIVDEQIIKIDNALLVLKGSKISDIQTVYSHPQALMQSAKFLQEHREWKQVSLQNTAVAAKKVLEEKDKTQAAIASAYAAEAYGLDILQEGINDKDINSTRFIIVSNQKIYREDAGKITICFELPNKSGTLYNIISNFIYNNLNMTKIESRPLEDRNWEYYFIVNFEGNLSDASVKNALRGIQNEAANFKILGNY